MAFWNTTKLKQECQSQGLIEPYREERAFRSAYELGVGSEAYITSKDDDNTHLPENSKVIIPPGQFGLLTTLEKVYVPPNAIAFISIRARIKFQGLVNVSGFHVDPGYRGKLKFAVYNAGSKNIVLDQDERVFMIWYADLNDATPDPYPPLQETASFITSDDVTKLKGEVASPAELKKQIDEIKHDYDKRIQSVETNQKITHWLVGGLIFLLLGMMVKAGWFDRISESKPSGASTVAKVEPREIADVDGIRELVGSGTNQLGWWIVVGAVLVAISIVVSTIIILKQNRPISRSPLPPPKPKVKN